MKKVFSLVKFVEWCKNKNYRDESIKVHLETWGFECIGKTEKEMNEIGFITREEWMKEVENN